MFHAVRRDTGLTVAVKVQRDVLLAVDRMRREIDVLSRLDHPNVIRIVEADRGARWYAMPLARYALRDFHDRSPADWESFHGVLHQVCAALRYLEDRGLVHRDVSPGNVLYLGDDRWVLSDFGLVKRPRSSSLTRTGMRFGTPHFSAPEVHHDPRTATGAADVYSIGALASWFTNIAIDQQPDSAWGVYWHEFICGTLRFNPAQRWSLEQAWTHLKQPPDPVLVPVGWGRDACARCQACDGLDGAGRCVRCGFLDEP